LEITMENFAILNTTPTRAHKGKDGWQVETSYTLSGSPERILRVSTYKRGQELLSRASVHKVIGQGMLEHVIGFHGRRAGDFRKDVRREMVKMVTKRVASDFHQRAIATVAEIIVEASEHYQLLLEAAESTEEEHA
jgi:hypothetical protein